MYEDDFCASVGEIQNAILMERASAFILSLVKDNSATLLCRLGATGRGIADYTKDKLR